MIIANIQEHTMKLFTIRFFTPLLRRGQNPLHVLGQYGKENAAAIFDLFMECMPKYPLNLPDVNGNTGTVPVVRRTKEIGCQNDFAEQLLTN